MITGFPSPAQGYEDKTFDLNSLIIKHPAATVFMTVDTNRYCGMGIYCGDLLAIDRAKKVNENSLVVYEREGQFVLGRVFNIRKQQGAEEQEIIITGAVTHVIHTVREN